MCFPPITLLFAKQDLKDKFKEHLNSAFSGALKCAKAMEAFMLPGKSLCSFRDHNWKKTVLNLFSLLSHWITRMGVFPQILRDNQIPISTLNFLFHITCLAICREQEFPADPGKLLTTTSAHGRNTTAPHFPSVILLQKEVIRTEDY